MGIRREKMLMVLDVVMMIIMIAVYADEHEFTDGQQVPVYVNTIGSFHNPAEAFDYYSLPMCAPDEIIDVASSLGGRLSGSRMHNSVFAIEFGKFIKRQTTCKRTLTKQEIRRFIDIIDKDYAFKLHIDELPVQGFFGEKETTVLEFDDHVHNVTRYFLYPHTVFGMQFNGPNIISCILTTDADNRVELKDSFDKLSVEFSYSVDWEETDVTFGDRLKLHAKHLWNDQAMNIHWLSIINSFILVLLLTVFLSIIVLRVLRNDFARYSDTDDEILPLDGNADESGWKQVHGDVFRFPAHPIAFCALIGTGTHLFICFCILLILSLFDTFAMGSGGALYSTAIGVFTITAPISGYISGYLYAQIGGGSKKWATTAVATALIFCFPLLVVFLTLNTIADSYGSAVAVPGWTAFALILFWALIVFPLTVAGSMRGRAAAKPFETPCKTNRVRREIPPLPWFQTKLASAFMAGFLPFSAIYIEMHYIFAAVWGHQVYRLFGMLCLAFVMVVLVAAFITVSLTYFQLAHENYNWWWSSFLNGGSSGAFVFAYSMFYFFFRSSMSGALQGAFFFGYMFIVSLVFSLMLGAVGFASSLPFVRYIYASIKSD